MLIAHLTLSEYHAMPEVSHSQLEVLITSAPLYNGRYITHEYPRKESSELDIGSAVHDLLSSGRDIAEFVAIPPPEVLAKNGARSTKAFYEWRDKQTAIGKIILTEAESKTVSIMVANIKRAVPSWITGCPCNHEASFTWHDPTTDLDCRCRPDMLVHTFNGLVVVDYKTTRAVHPRRFSADCAEFGYHRQAAYYWDGLVANGLDPRAFLFIAVDKSPAHSVWLYEMKKSAIELGRQQNHQALHELARRLETGSWDEPAHGEIIELDVPTYCYRQDPFSLEINQT